VEEVVVPNVMQWNHNGMKMHIIHIISTVKVTIIVLGDLEIMINTFKFNLRNQKINFILKVIEKILVAPHFCIPLFVY
jgi:hypothetical protein